jgi:4-amino-4-deoxy-L-arabinose transferase-like glycosyltransferase
VDAIEIPGRRLNQQWLLIPNVEAHVVVVILLILLGTALRLVPLVAEPFHQDEALYGYWGRLINTGRDIFLTSVPVDKPPLVPYLIAASQSILGTSRFAVRMPGFAASLLAIPVTYALAYRLYGNRISALVAAAVMALSPYSVLFGATAFTDPVLMTLWLVACWAALTRRWGWAGLFLGLAFASKQNAVALAPLVIGFAVIGWQRQAASTGSRQWATDAAAFGRDTGPALSPLRMAVSFLFGLGLAVAMVGTWDQIRVVNGSLHGFWDQGVDSYGGLRLVLPGEVRPRLQGWAHLGGYIFSEPWLAVLVLAGAGALLSYDLTKLRRTWAALADVLLISFACFYLFLCWLVAFPLWDRYLLPLVPVAALLMGRIVAVLHRQWCHRKRVRRQQSRILVAAFLSAVLAVLAISGLSAANGRVPVGGDHGAYDGLQEVADYLRGLPPGTVLYDRWLSWHYDFYLYDALLYRAGFPSPEWLAADAAVFLDGRPRYLVLPNWESPVRLQRALAAENLTMSPVLVTHRRDGVTSFVVYEISAKDT